MYVKIGPYPKHWSVNKLEEWYYQIKHKKYPWELKNSDYTKFDHFFNYVCEQIQHALNFTLNRWAEKRGQKITIKLHKYDSYNVDHTLSLIIHPLLIQLKETTHGSQLVDNEDVPEYLQVEDFSVLSEDEQYELIIKRWNYVMDSMIWSFEQLANNNDDQSFYSGNTDFKFIPVDKDGNEIPEDDAELFQMVEGPNHTAIFDKEGYMKHSNKINEGLRLFGKYFRGLWD